MNCLLTWMKLQFISIHSNYIVSENGLKTVSVRRGYISARDALFALLWLLTERKCLYLFFKAAENGPFANSLNSIMPSGIYGRTQKKGLMDNRVMQEWKEKIWMPFVQRKSN